MCPDKRINDQIVKLLSFDIEIVYDKGESTQIDLADFISRTEYLKKPCTSSCRICVDKQDAIGESYRKTLELLTLETQPSVGFEHFESVFATVDEKVFRWHARDIKHSEIMTMNSHKNELNEMVLRSHNKRFTQKLKSNDSSVKKARELIKRM